MSLSKYRRPRLLVQNPRRSVHDAARAMESHGAALVLVQENGQLVGLLTARDVAVRVVGYGLDPVRTLIAEVMTPDPVTLSVDATEDEALELMEARVIRRVPLLDGSRVAGLVSLDDMLVEGTVNPSRLARAAALQLARSSPLPAHGRVVAAEDLPRAPAPQRRREGLEDARGHRYGARAEEAFGRLVHRVQTMAGLDSREVALTALELVLSGVLRRITVEEASDFLAELPSTLRDRLADVPAGPDRTVTRGAIEAELARRLDIDAPKAARVVTDVGAALEQAVSGGEIEDVLSQLPGEMRAMFPKVQARLP